MYDIADAFPTSTAISEQKTANIFKKLSGSDAKKLKRTKQKFLILLVVFTILFSTVPVNLAAADDSLPNGSGAGLEGGGSISGFLWIDGNDASPTGWNGLYDAGEQPLADYPVYLYAADNLLAPIAQTKTSLDGTYAFNNIEPGNYVVEIASAFVCGTEYLLPIRVTSESVFTVDSKFNPPMAFSPVLTVTSGSSIENINAGMRLPLGFMPFRNGNDWIEIWTSDDLRNITENLSGKYIQMADIDLDGKPFTPIGNQSSPFTGTYDGNRYMISGLNVSGPFSYAGLFGSAQNSDIMNITLDSSCDISSSAATAYIGGIIGYARGNVSVTNCYNKGNVSAGASTAYIGGIIGFAFGNVSVTNCYLAGNVKTTAPTSNLGGILGFANGNISVKNCYNIGSIDAAGVYPYVGGIIGQVYKGDARVDTCYNTGDMNITVNPGGNAFAGGMIGIVRTHAHVTNCYNAAPLNIKGDYMHVGGIIGYVYYGGADVTNCYNAGDVNITGSTTIAGGILGDCLFEGNSIMDNCYNTGNITADFAAGGLVGYAGGNASMNFNVVNSRNTGYVKRSASPDVSGYAGGIIGWVKNGYAGVTDCYNTGNVSSSGATNTYAGGIIGHTSVNVDVMNCYNTGDVSSETASGNSATFAHAGGIIGYAYSGISNVTNCFSTGDVAASVAATNGAGGIIGYVDRGEARVTNSYNTGNMTSDNAGGIVGQVNSTGSCTGANAYFLDNNAQGSGKGLVFGSVTQITSKELQNPAGPAGAFSTHQGGIYAGTWAFDGNVNNGYPILTSIVDSLFTVILVSSPSEGGNLFGGAAHAGGSEATVLAFPERGYQFVRWEEKNINVNSSEEYAFGVTGSRNLVAIFEKTSDSPTVILQYVNRAGEEIRPKYVVTSALTPGSVYSPAKDTDDVFGNKLTDVPGFVLIDWKLSTDSGWAGNTNPSINVFLGTAFIVLLYGQDIVDGNGSQTSDGIEDVNIIMKWVSTTEAEIKPSQMVSMDVPCHFEREGGDIKGYTYQGYKIDGGAQIRGTPDIDLEGGPDVTVTYVYRADSRFPSQGSGFGNSSTGNSSPDPSVQSKPPSQGGDIETWQPYLLIILLFPIAVAIFLFLWKRRDEEDQK